MSQAPTSKLPTQMRQEPFYPDYAGPKLEFLTYEELKIQNKELARQAEFQKKVMEAQAAQRRARNLRYLTDVLPRLEAANDTSSSSISQTTSRDVPSSCTTPQLYHGAPSPSVVDSGRFAPFQYDMSSRESSVLEKFSGMSLQNAAPQAKEPVRQAATVKSPVSRPASKASISKPTPKASASKPLDMAPAKAKASVSKPTIKSSVSKPTSTVSASKPAVTESPSRKAPFDRPVRVIKCDPVWLAAFCRCLSWRAAVHRAGADAPAEWSEVRPAAGSTSRAELKAWKAWNKERIQEVATHVTPLPDAHSRHTGIHA